MKTIFRVLTLGFIMTAFSAASTFAQDVCAEVEAKQALYKKFTDNYAGTVDQKKSAVEAGDQYIGKYGACAEDKDIVTYLNTNLPAMKKSIKDSEAKGVITARNKGFDTAVDAANVSDIFSTGKVILAQEPDFLDVTLALANAGFEQIEKNPTANTYNDDVLTYSRNGIQQIEADKKSITKGYGVKKYSYKTDKFTDGKSSALGSLNYNIGYILYYRQGKDNAAKRKEALPYFYKSTQYNAFSKTSPLVYQAIGAWYLDEAVRLDTERQAKLKEAGNKDTDETLAQLALQKGYADRSIDAYARAYSLAKVNTDPKNKPYTDGLYTKLKELYAFRYDGNTAGVDAFVSSVMSKPLPDPSTEVTPVKDAPATTTTTTTSSTMTSDDNSAKPAATDTPAAAAKPVTAKATAAAKPAAAKAAAPVKKPAAKKKKTR